MPDSCPNTIRFSTDDLPEKTRVEAFREIYARKIIKIDFEPLPEHPFRFDAIFHSLPGFMFASGTISASRGSLTSELIESDDILLNVSLSGGRIIQQRGREAMVGPREGGLTTSADPGVVTIHSTSRFFSFRIARDTLRPAVGDLDACLQRTIPRETDSLRLLTSYAGMIEGCEAITKPDVRSLIAAHFHDLISVTLGASRDATEIARGRGIRAARLCAVKNDILENLVNADLSMDMIASRQGITARYLRMLFADEATSFTDFVLANRLERTHRMLSDQRFAAQSISTVAFSCGFGDLSYFNRSFRRRYQATPTDVRETARRATS
jgi:AraC-like DNA-binding protein